MKLGPDDDHGLQHEISTLRQLRPTTGIRLPTLSWEHRHDGWLAACMPAVETDGRALSFGAVARVSAALVGGELGVPVTHRDLAPWNVASVGGVASIWDWETAEIGTGRPLHDLVHYIIRSGVLLGSVTPQTTARLLCDRGGPGYIHLTRLGLAPRNAADFVREYLTDTSADSETEAAYRASLAAAL